MANTNFGSASDAMNEAASKVGDVASRVQGKVSELGQRASEFGERAVGAMDAQRTAAADRLGDTADYLRGTSMRDMLSQVEKYVKAHPTQALIGAVCMGFFAGRGLRRS